MKLKLFWQENCPNCPQAKRLVSKLEAIDVSSYDIKSIDGMAEAAFHSVMATPSILVVDNEDNELVSWRTDTPLESELMETLDSLS